MEKLLTRLLLLDFFVLGVSAGDVHFH
jgi:hypothetical protein